MNPVATRKDPRLDLHWVESGFDRVAWSYPFFERLFLVPKRARDLAVDRLMIRPGQRILSIGCGRGPMLPALSARTGSTGSVVGLDLSARMLHFAQRRVQEDGLVNVRLIRTNVLDHHDGPYDAVLFGFSLSSFGDPCLALDHAWKLVRPGGRLVVLDGQLPPRSRRFAIPLMPAIRWFLEHTVLGNPDMRPLEELERLGAPYSVDYLRAGSYFVATTTKPSDPIPDASTG